MASARKLWALGFLAGRGAAYGAPAAFTTGLTRASLRPLSRLLPGGDERSSGWSGRHASSAAGAPAARARAAVALGVLAATGATAAAAAEGALPPVAPRRPHIVKIGRVEGEERGADAFDPPKEMSDDLFWLRDDKREDAEVLAHLAAENAYTEAQTSHLDRFRDSLYKELLSHVQETDDSAPYPHGPFDYYTRTVEGLSYVLHCRRPKGAGKASGKEAMLLDENELAKQHPDHCDVGAVEPSPSHELLGFSVDGKGYETYQIKFKRLGGGGEHPPDVLEETSGDLVWGGDDSSVYYTKFDEAHRPNSVWRHELGTPQAADTKLFEDPDGLFYVSLGKSRDGRLLLVQSHSSETSEVHLMEVTDAKGRALDSAAKGGQGGAPAGPAPALRVVQPRQDKLRYAVAHRNGYLFITTNEGECHNQKIVVAPLATPGMEHWRPLCDAQGGAVMAHEPSRTISYATCFQEHLVVGGREGGLTQVWVLDLAGPGPAVREWHRIAWPESAYECGLGPNEEFSTKQLRLGYSSPTTPRRALLYDMGPSRRSVVLKQTPVPNYDPALYATARRQLEARDGTLVPVTLLWRKDRVPVSQPESGAPAVPAPLHLYGYGSYGMSIEPSFSSRSLPLIDRGVVYAIAHVRGGSEMGRYQWYEESGKYLSKRNTFNDFVDVAGALVKSGWTTPAQMSCEGRSAGGLLVGNVLNQAPHLFRAAIAGVPFVDLITTMCDPSIPLTVGEWAEWGNPNEPKYFEYMLSYSPVNQVKAQDYPAILATSGLHDPRVAYWEPAKWVQLLREKRTNAPDDPRKVLLKMDLAAGHFSASDRYKYLKELAFDYAWLLDELGLRAADGEGGAGKGAPAAAPKK